MLIRRKNISYDILNGTVFCDITHLTLVPKYHNHFRSPLGGGVIRCIFHQDTSNTFIFQKNYFLFFLTTYKKMPICTTYIHIIFIYAYAYIQCNVCIFYAYYAYVIILCIPVLVSLPLSMKVCIQYLRYCTCTSDRAVFYLYYTHI